MKYMLIVMDSPTDSQPEVLMYPYLEAAKRAAVNDYKPEAGWIFTILSVSPAVKFKIVSQAIVPDTKLVWK